ncbi:hypothetical protein [Microbacterium sp. NPDC057650]
MGLRAEDGDDFPSSALSLPGQDAPVRWRPEQATRRTASTTAAANR